MIDVRHLTKTYRVREQESGFAGALRGIVSPRYRDVTALRDVSLSVASGEFVGFLVSLATPSRTSSTQLRLPPLLFVAARARGIRPPTAPARPTALKCLTGLLTPTAGHVQVLGFNPTRRQYAFRRRFALVLGQKSSLWWDVPAREGFLREGPQRRLDVARDVPAREGFLLQKEIYEIPTDRYREGLAEMVDTLGVAHLLSTPVRQLSLGERMKMELIAGLLHQPELLFLDEPTIGLDLVSQERVRGFLREHNARRGTTIVLTSHYMEDIRALCPRIVVLGGGAVAYDGPLRALVARLGGGERRVRVTFSGDVGRSDIARFGHMVDVQPGPPPTAELAVRPDAVPGVSAALLAALPVVDIAITEPSAEDVLRRLYQGQAMH